MDALDLLLKSNPYHEPAGSPEGGQFASADAGASIGEFASSRYKGVSPENARILHQCVTDAGIDPNKVVTGVRTKGWFGDHDPKSGRLRISATAGDSEKLKAAMKEDDEGIDKKDRRGLSTYEDKHIP